MTDIPEDVMKAVNEALAKPDVDEHGNCARYFIGGRYLHIVQNCIARAIMAERERSQWQPIETAPKDGESILIWKPDERRVGEYLMTAYWDEDQNGFVPVGGIHKQGYYSTWEDCEQGYPTHWMPLPKPPEVS